MLVVAFAVAIITFVVSLLILLKYIRWHYGTLEKLGIPVVKPHFILGSCPDHHEVVNHEVDYAWFKQYGEVFGVYEGRVPKIYVCDPEIVRQVFIKQADKFPNRGLGDNFDMGTLADEFLDFIEDEKWKAVRSAFSPVFTSSKLKKMFHHMIQVSKEFTETVKSDIMKTEKGIIENYDLHQDIYLMLVDLIARCTLNVKVQDARNPNNEFAAALTALFHGTSEASSKVIKKLRLSLPFLHKLATSKTLDSSVEFFERIYKHVLEQREKSGENTDDFLGVILDLMHRVKSDEYQKLGITEQTIIANAVEFYVAGQDNMSTALTMLAFYLSRNPEVEARLYREVDAYFERYNGEVQYESLHELVYLNACLQEALRLHPVFTRTDRKCAEDVEINGIKFKKGIAVVVPLWPYNRNPKYFPDGDAFNPERFMPQNKDKLNQMVLATFGWGPRKCIGQRFALEGMLVTASYLFKNFKFTTRPDAVVKYAPGMAILGMVESIPLNIQFR